MHGKLVVFVLVAMVSVRGGWAQDSSRGSSSDAVERFAVDEHHARAGAVRVAGRALVHTTQLLAPHSGGKPTASANPASATPASATPTSATAHLDQLLSELDNLLTDVGARRVDLVKLNWYLPEQTPPEAVSEKLRGWLPKGHYPASATVTTELPGGAKVGLDAVIAAPVKQAPAGSRPAVSAQRLSETRRRARYAVLPRGDVLYISGQAARGDLAEATRETLAGLFKTLTHLGQTPGDVVQVKCFLEPIREASVVDKVIAEAFPEGLIPPTTHVQWRAGSLPIEIELVVFAPAAKGRAADGETVTFHTPPWLKASPVFSRAARIRGDRRIYFSGLVAADQDLREQAGGEGEVRSIFRQLAQLAKASGSDLRHLAKATYYVAADDASAQLNRLRPEFYDPARPPAASKALVAGVGHPRRTITVDMIGAAKPASR